MSADWAATARATGRAAANLNLPVRAAGLRRRRRAAAAGLGVDAAQQLPRRDSCHGHGVGAGDRAGPRHGSLPVSQPGQARAVTVTRRRPAAGAGPGNLALPMRLELEFNQLVSA